MQLPVNSDAIACWHAVTRVKDFLSFVERWFFWKTPGILKNTFSTWGEMDDLYKNNFDIAAKVSFFERERLKRQAKKEQRPRGAILREALRLYLDAREEPKAAS